MADYSNKKILVINVGGIGDLLLSSPSLKALRHRFPHAHISILTSSRGQEVVRDLMYIDKIFVFAITHGGTIPLRKILSNIILLLRLRLKRFDIALNMRTLVSKRSARKIKLLLGIIRPKISVGRDTQKRGYFFDVKIPESMPASKHAMEYDFDTVKALGAEVLEKEPELVVDESSKRKVDSMLKDKGISKARMLIGIHPGGMPSRRWPIERFAKVMKQMHQELNCVFLITGSGNEKDLSGKLKELVAVDSIDLVDMLTLKELAALIQSCNLFISNDTGPMHIAAILKTPLVAIIGPGDVTRYDPRRLNKRAVVLYERAQCSPCYSATCSSIKCLHAIDPQDVFEACVSLLR